MKLTQRVIEGLACPGERKDMIVFDDEQKGLGVRVSAGGSKSYLVQFRVDGAKQRLPLGSVDAISLRDAREATRKILGDAAKGMNPAMQRRAAAAAARQRKENDSFTLAGLIDDWERMGLADNKPGYRAEATRALRKGMAGHLDKPASGIDRKLVLAAHDELVKQGKGTTAARVVAYGKACYGWALKRGTVETNPFTAQPVQVPRQRDRVLSDLELKEVWNRADPATTFGAIVRTLILTGQRRDEVSGMVWEELSADLSTWTIPGHRAKNGAVHVVPLASPVRDLIKAQARLVRNDGELDFVFSGRLGGQFSGWSRAKANLDAGILAARIKAAEKAGLAPKAVKPMESWVLHDLRRTLATGLQRFGVRLEVTEAVLNHVSGSRAGIVGVYQRHDFAEEKRAALDAWARHVTSVVSGEASAGNVFPLRPTA